MKKSYKTRGRGFTLIELLAVLVVLAILALIAIPIVIKVINNAREDSYKRSIESYARTIEMGLARWAIANPGEAFPNQLSEIDDYIDYKGDIVECNDFSIDSKGLVKLEKCQIKDRDTQKEKSTNWYKYVNGKVDDDTEPIYEEYSVGDTFLFSGSTYYVITPTDNKEPYVTALKAEPLTADEVINLGFDVVSITEQGYGRIFFDNTEPLSSNYDQSDVKQIVDKWNSILNKGIKEIRLITKRELTLYLGYEDKEKGTMFASSNGSETPTWVYNNNYCYYTMSVFNDSSYLLWSVSNNGRLDPIYGTNNNECTIRPVINVLKSAITKN